MLIGDPSSFAIEAYREPIPNSSSRVFGRMCIYANDAALGDINEPTCMLNVTEGHLIAILARLDDLEDEDINLLSDRETFDFLDRALYLDDDRTLQEVQSDAARYFKFDFLTNGGESFDRTKSFIAKSGDTLRLLFTDESDTFRVARVPQREFRDCVTDFLEWINRETLNAPVQPSVPADARRRL